MTDTPMTHFFAEPADVLLFRDGRPFSAGDDHHATGPFPPPPSAVYGALRSAYLAHAGADFRAHDFGLTGAHRHALGSRTAPGALTLAALTLARRTPGGVERLWPMPPAVVQTKGDAPSFARVTPTAVPGGLTDLPDGLLPLLPPPHAAATFYDRAGGLLTDAGWNAVLDGGLPAPEHVVPVRDVFQREPRTQVSLRGVSDVDFTGTAQEGQLFTVDFVRLAAGAGLLLGVEHAPEGAAPALLRLGGESRATRLEAIAAPDAASDARRAAARASGRVALILTTPCPNADGWQPEAVEPGALRLPDGRALAARLLGAAVGRHETVGGWDVAARQPKPARRAAPAASTYFFEGVEAPDELFDALDGRSICLHATDRAQGFGLVRLGTW